MTPAVPHVTHQAGTARGNRPDRRSDWTSAPAHLAESEIELTSQPAFPLPSGAVARRITVCGGVLAVIDAAAPVRSTSTVVFVPGYTGSKEDFLLLLPLVRASGRRAVAYDQRGQHESPGIPDSGAYTVASLAADLLALVDELRCGPVHVVGHSFGGLVGRAATIARPAAVRSLTLLGSGPAAVDGRRAEHIRLLRPVLLSDGPTAVWERMAELAAADGAPPQPPSIAAFLRTRFFASSPDGLRAMGDELLAERDRVDELRATGRPVLVAHGERDDAWPPSVQAEMAARLGATYAVVAGAAHSPNIEAQAATAAALTAFWDEVERG